MTVKHNKTGILHNLWSEKCKAKINGEWKDAVVYRGWEKNTGEYYYFVREKSDFEANFTAVGGKKLSDSTYIDLVHFIHVLKGIAEEYPGKTIENVIVQLEARLKELN